MFELVNTEPQDVAQSGALFVNGFFEIGRKDMVEASLIGEGAAHEVQEQVVVGIAQGVAVRIEQTVGISAIFDTTENIKCDVSDRSGHWRQGLQKGCV